MKNKAPKTGRYRWVVAIMFFTVYMIAGADRANIGVVVPFIKEEYHMTNADIGMLASLFYLTYALVQIPSGFLFSRFGIGKILSACMILTSLSTLLMGFTNSILQLKVARALLGALFFICFIPYVAMQGVWYTEIYQQHVDGR